MGSPRRELDMQEVAARFDSTINSFAFITGGE